MCATQNLTAVFVHVSDCELFTAIPVTHDEAAKEITL